MNCPNCGTPNDGNNRFCLRCGSPMAAAVIAQPPPVTAMPTQPATQTMLGGVAGASPVTPPPNVYSAPPPPSSAYGQPGLYGAPGTTGLNIWGPFAGYGSRRRHVGWLLNSEGHHARDLQAEVEQRFREREVPGTAITNQTLQAQGVIVETRPYFILRRGLVSLALYIAQFGKDLFISQVAYLKPPISNLRAIVVAAMGLFWLWMTFAYSSAVMGQFGGFAGSFNPFGGAQSDPGGLVTLLCVIGPLGAVNNVLLFILLIYSVYKWLTEKDFAAALRVPPNEFNEDDLMAMEKAVEETVRQSLTAIKLDPKDLQQTAAPAGRFF